MDNDHLVEPAPLHERGSITVFVSYTHESSEHKGRVLNLVQRLRRDGIDCTLDAFHPFPIQGWIAWMEEQIRARRWTLVVASESYKRRAEGQEEPEVGQGAKFESGAIRRELYESGGLNERFVPIGFGAESRKFVPGFLRDYSFFDVDDAEAYTKLLCVLTGHPFVVPENLGKPVVPRLGLEKLESSTTELLSEESLGGLYAEEDESDASFFGGVCMVPNYVGVLSMKVRPVFRKEDRLPRRTLASALSSISAVYCVRANVPDNVPFEAGSRGDGFDSGAGRQIATIEPKWKRCEGVRLHKSGQYAIMRVFEEDYSDDGTLTVYSNWELWLEHFIFRVSLMYLLARNVARTLNLPESEHIEIKVRVSGLRNRSVVAFDRYPTAGVASLLKDGRPGTTEQHRARVLSTVGQFERSVLSNAATFVHDVLFNFDLDSDGIEDYVKKVQRDLIGDTEPLAFPNA